MYTVKELARLTGLTPRTLRYYDSIGLLRPARDRENDYRLYGPGEVDRLQQILLYRQMGLPLEEIRLILDAPGFDRGSPGRRPDTPRRGAAGTFNAPPGKTARDGDADPHRP